MISLTPFVNWMPTAEITINSVAPSEAYPDDTVTVNYTVDNPLWHHGIATGFINGYVTRDYMSKLLSSDFDAQSYTLQPGEQQKGVLMMSKWNYDSLFLYYGSGHETKSGPANAFGSFDVVLETWEPGFVPQEVVNSTMPFNGTLYASDYLDSMPIDVYPICGSHVQANA